MVQNETNAPIIVKGLSGLGNLGNTCYINSCMQVLSHIQELNDYIHLIYPILSKNRQDVDVTFIREWKDLYDLMWSRNCIVSPNRFIKIIHIISDTKKKDMFSGFEQNDVTEFMYYLFDCFHNGFKTVPDVRLLQNYVNVFKSYNDSSLFTHFKNTIENDFSLMNILFGGIYVDEIVDLKTKKKYSRRFDNFNIIDLPLNSTDLNECLDSYFASEIMNKDNDNQYHDDETDTYTDVCKSHRIIHFPNILIIQLKRWNYNLRKNQRIIHFDIDEELDMTRYSSAPDRKGLHRYKLFASINHSGNIFGGHYHSYIKSSNDKWYCFNDTHVSEIKKENVKSNKNYVLIYRKVT